MVDRATGRLRPLLLGPAGRAGALRVLEELLPLDADRRDGVQVYLAFVVRAHLDPALRRVRDAAEAASRDLVRAALAMLAADGPLEDPAALADQTYALLDGLALHGALWPERYPPDHLRRVLVAHVDRLRR